MSLAERLTEDLKLAMKARDQLRMDVIRMAKAALLNKEIELKKDLDESEMNRVLITLVKQRKEAAEQYLEAKRQDLAVHVRQHPLNAIIGADGELLRIGGKQLRRSLRLGFVEQFFLQDRAARPVGHRKRRARNRLSHDQGRGQGDESGDGEVSRKGRGRQADQRVSQGQTSTRLI